jgi:hypothetical protein
VAFHGAIHLDAETVVRRNEIGADQQQDDVGAFEAFAYRGANLSSWRDAVVAPDVQRPLAL